VCDVGPSSTGAGSHTLLITDGSGNTDANLTFTLATGTQSSFFYSGPGVFGGFIVQATDDTTPAANSQAKLRIIVATGLSPNLDTYVVPTGTSPSGNPTVSGTAPTLRFKLSDDCSG
jgi:hypothetical protein